MKDADKSAFFRIQKQWLCGADRWVWSRFRQTFHIHGWRKCGI